MVENQNNLIEKVMSVNTSNPDLNDRSYVEELKELCVMIDGKIPDWADGVVIAKLAPICLPGAYPIKKSKFGGFYFKRYWRSLISSRDAIRFERGKLGNIIILKDGRILYPKRIEGNWNSDYINLVME
jgi:hypothetical protein